ncbi:MAG: hypothetical protein AB7S26_09430 [Sandaracinaceae bacterium]
MPTHARAWLLVLAVTACGSSGRGDGAMGSPCDSPDQCRHGLCVGGSVGQDAVCTRSCAATSECPQGWSCSGVTANNVLVCQRGAGNPFGVGTRE